MAGGIDGPGRGRCNPLDPGLTMTAAMTNAVGRHRPGRRADAAFQVLFFVGLLLFLLTLGLNLIGDRFVRRVRQMY